jgi:hypothetical protein
VAAELDEGDATFGDEPPREALGGAETLGGLADGEQSASHGVTLGR